MIHLKKFTLRQDWTPIKLDVSVDMPEDMDLEYLRGHGAQEGENLLVETIGVILIIKTLLACDMLCYNHNHKHYYFFRTCTSVCVR